jgi:hypothetical protein
MGSGVALGVKNTWPHVYVDYMKHHEYDASGLKLGRAYNVPASKDLMIWNAITQGNFGRGQRQVSYDAIATCFEEVNDFIKADIEADVEYSHEVHIPMIGAARGGGNWEIIREIIEQTMDYPVTLWLPDSTVTTL